MEEWEKAWLACAIDGEGTVSFLHNTNQNAIPVKGSFPFIQISNNNYAFIARAVELLRSTGAKVGVYSYIHRNRQNEKRTFQIRVYHKDHVEKVLKVILPYLIIKREHAENVLAFIVLRRSKIARKGIESPMRFDAEEFALINRVRSLNRASVGVRLYHKSQNLPEPTEEYVKGSCRRVSTV